MTKLNLDGVWQMKGAGYACEGTVPGSVYSFLLDNHLMEDPYYRQNELDAFKIMEHEFEFSRTFEFEPTGDCVLLQCEGLDTLCDIYINGVHVAHTDNMHRAYEFDVTELLKAGENEIRLVFAPPVPYVTEKAKEEALFGATDCVEGAGHLRKAHCMMGWDWGPRLPDAGIWKDIQLLVLDSARITDFHIWQRHECDQVYITANVQTDKEAMVAVTVIAPDGTTFTIPANVETQIEQPKLWWPNGLGEQPLYTVKAEVLEGGMVADSQEKRIGLRTMKLIRERDKYGESFCHEVNGVRFFAMGADYIPEDNILSRITPERTYRLLKQCRDCNFNAIRVWGGGFYPHDFFFDACDELGIIVFHDMMVACTTIQNSEEMKQNFRIEVKENLTRIRHHASLALISGNNELEITYVNNPHLMTPTFVSTYLEVYEDMLPEVVKEVCPYIDYIPSSPTTSGHFIDPQNDNYGDQHYWDIWFGNIPFTAYRNKFFRYLSEFGFQSFPCEKTIEAFTEEKDRNIFSRVMEMHQRSGVGNGRILSYLANTYKYPTEFGTLLYASQILQAEAIRYGVEHLRRHRGRCMGALYWQLNDIWPTASWSSIDYYGRWKALQYVAKRFYKPIMISCQEIGEKAFRPLVTMDPRIGYETKAQLCVTNETLQDVTGVVTWALRDNTGAILQEGKEEVTVPSLTSVWLEEMDFARTDVEHNYISYAFCVNGEIVSEGTTLFTAPKHFEYVDPQLRYEINGDEITVFTNAYASYVEIDSPDFDMILSDNYFDINEGAKTVKILEGTAKNIRLRSVYDIQ